MSAQDQMRAMLDQLMGTARDGEENKFKLRFDDPRVCKSFLLGCCPHEILASTRMDLGDCPKVHELALKADYEMACKKRDYYYDIDAMEHLQSFINDCDRRTEMAKRRLKDTQDELSDEATTKVEMIHMLGEKIGTKLAKAEEFGAKGEVEESMVLMQEVDDLKKEKLTAETDYRNTMPASSYQQQKLRVCEVCSAYLGIHDNDRRLADHFGGKLHLGFITIREKLTNLQQKVLERRLEREREFKERHFKEERVKKEREESRMKEREERGKTGRRSRSRSKGRSRGSRRSRSRSRSRDKHRRHRRSRSRSRDRRRRRSRERRSRSGRSHSRSRRHRSRSSSKRRDRSRSHSKRKSQSGSPAENRAASQDKSNNDKGVSPANGAPSQALATGGE